MAKADSKKEEVIEEAGGSLIDNGGTQIDGGDLDTLRDILFGPQVQETDSRLGVLEKKLLQTRKELSASIAEEVGSLRDTSNAQLEAARQELVWQLEKQNNEQTSQLRTQQEEQKIALDKLSVDLNEKLSAAQQKLGEKIDDLSNSLSEQLMEMQADFRQRDDDLRQQMLTVSAWLDERKTSREDLSALLIAMGGELQKSKKSRIIDMGNEESE